MSAVKILVVEDESIVAMDIKNRLEKLNYDVPAIISSGEEAVKKAGEILPDLILMDIILKGDMDGIEASQIIKDKYNIPIVFLTAYSDEKTLKRAKITGPFGYVIKPFDDRDVHSSIEVALHKHEMESKLRASEKWLFTILESIGEAVITTDENGKITFMNPLAQKITCWSQEEAVGNQIENVFSTVNEETGEKTNLSVDKILEGSIDNINENISLVNKKGDLIPIYNNNTPIIDDNNVKTGTVLVFQDISQRKKAEKEREQLLQEKARSELFGFLISAIPVFASNIPPQIRNNIAKSFADRFERNIRPVFEESMSNCMNIKENNLDNCLKCYMGWVEGFLSNLGIELKEFSTPKNSIIFSKCPWKNESSYSPMFCLICRIILIRSFTWTNIEGHVEQVTCMAEGSNDCMFQFNLLKDEI